MDTIKEMDVEAKDWVVEHKCAVAAGIGFLGIVALLGLAAENKDNPEILGPILKLTSELSKPVQLLAIRGVETRPLYFLLYLKIREIYMLYYEKNTGERSEYNT